MSVHGLCSRDELHEAHAFEVVATGSVWVCPGQHSECRNCDDRKCMGCIFRVWDHDCAEDCPECCPVGTDPGAVFDALSLAVDPGMHHERELNEF